MATDQSGSGTKKSTGVQKKVYDPFKLIPCLQFEGGQEVMGLCGLQKIPEKKLCKSVRQNTQVL